MLIMSKVNWNIEKVQSTLGDVFCTELCEGMVIFDWLKVDENVQKFGEGLISVLPEVKKKESIRTEMINLGRNNDDCWCEFSDYIDSVLDKVSSNSGFTRSFSDFKGDSK